jgi:hypothetical protein
VLIAGEKFVKNPFLRFARRPRKVYPRKSKLVCSASVRRFVSWQYTIFVFPGCSSSPTEPSRSARWASSLRACSSVSQWMIG